MRVRAPRTANDASSKITTRVRAAYARAPASHNAVVAGSTLNHYNHYRPSYGLLQVILIAQLLRNVLLGNEGDALREETVDFHLELVVEELVDLLLPLLVLEPWIGPHLFGPGDVLFGQLDD